MNAGERQVFTPAEAAAVLGRSRSWVEERCRDGRLPAIRDGGRYLLRRSDLIRDGWLTAPCLHGAAPVPIENQESIP
jgi:excisionase family DNA binding protein